MRKVWFSFWWCFILQAGKVSWQTMLWLGFLGSSLQRLNHRAIVHTYTYWIFPYIHRHSIFYSPVFRVWFVGAFILFKVIGIINTPECLSLTLWNSFSKLLWHSKCLHCSWLPFCHCFLCNVASGLSGESAVVGEWGLLNMLFLYSPFALWPHDFCYRLSWYLTDLNLDLHFRTYFQFHKRNAFEIPPDEPFIWGVLARSVHSRVVLSYHFISRGCVFMVEIPSAV